MKSIIRRYDGIVATRFEQGEDGTCAMYLVDAQESMRSRRRVGMMPTKAAELIGWSGDAYEDPEREAARRLVERLMHYAKRIVIEHDMPPDILFNQLAAIDPEHRGPDDALAYAQRIKRGE